MQNRYFDTHCHLNGEFYESDIDKDIENAIKNNVDKMVLPGTNFADSLKAIELAKKFPENVFASAGLHPCSAFKDDFPNFLDSINPDDIVAVGETGIDLYHLETNPTLEEQRASFKRHLLYARKHKKPIIVHARDAEKEVYEMLIDFKDVTIIMHCYTGNWEWAQKFLELGAYISISGAITYNKTEFIKEVAKNTPLNRLIVETDAPFLSPVPYRGKPNKPFYVKSTADFVASIRSEEYDFVLKTLYENAKHIFNIR